MLLSHDSSADGDTDAEPASLLEEFVTVIAHELQTPIAIVTCAAETALAHEPEASPERRRILRMIDRNSRLASLMLRRLSVARDIEAGSVELSLEDIDLAELGSESVSDLRQVVLRSHPIEVNVARNPTVRADPTTAREIVFNLLSNAAKYSDEDAPIEVTIDAARDMVELEDATTAMLTTAARPCQGEGPGDPPPV